VSGELHAIVRELKELALRSGQIPSAAQIAAFLGSAKLLADRYGAEWIYTWARELVDEWLRLSYHEPSKTLTVTQKSLELLSQIGSQVNIIQEFEETVKVRKGLLQRLRGKG